mgnify:CR=1 FL=1
MLKNKRIFITGGAGFIGSHLVEQLIDNNEIVVYDTLHRNALLAYTDLKSHKNLTFVQGDVLDAQMLAKNMKGSDIVVHLASMAGVATIQKNPTRTLNINIFGTKNILEECRKQGINRFISYSTSEVYGPHIYQAKEDGMTTLGALGEPRWFYAMSKLSAEFLAYGYHLEHGIKFTSVRPFNIYGPRQIGVGAVHNFVVNAIKNEPLIVHTPGSQIRSWCYVSDIVDATLSILERKKAEGEVFNIGDPLSTSTNIQTAETIIRLTKSKSKIIFQEIKSPDVHIRVPNIDKAKKLLDFEPKVHFEEGLQKTIEWYSKLPKDKLA